MNARIMLLVVALTVPALLPVQETAASGPIIARGAEREAIKSTHILYRPNRPLHVYGNTVRRLNSRRR